MISFRLHHLHALVATLYSSPIGETNRVAAYFNAHRALGAKDRRWISQRLFTILRNRRLLEALIGEGKTSPESLVTMAEQLPEVSLDPFPWPVRYSISDALAKYLVADYGEEEAIRLASCFLEEAPCFIRVNSPKVSIEALRESLPFPTELGRIPGSLRLKKRYPLLHTPAFRRGWFEVQDESSQEAVANIPLHPSDQVLDFCAGSGGKSLAVAAHVRHVILHDTRKHVLQEAQLRSRRAGYKNISVAKKLRPGSFSVVLVDAPCTGSGVYRRRPEQKELFSEALLWGCVHAQRRILKEAMQYVQPGGLLVYMTCSLLSHENERQVEWFRTSDWEVEQQVHYPLLSGGGDGFFSCHLRKR